LDCIANTAPGPAVWLADGGRRYVPLIIQGCFATVATDCGGPSGRCSRAWLARWQKKSIAGLVDISRPFLRRINEAQIQPEYGCGRKPSSDPNTKGETPCDSWRIVKANKDSEAGVLPSKGVAGRDGEVHLKRW